MGNPRPKIIKTAPHLLLLQHSFSSSSSSYSLSSSSYSSWWADFRCVAAGRAPMRVGARLAIQARRASL
eukprot:2052238-Pyramimonas_sp.AAC.1